MAELRASQRVPQRCLECARRRVKCDKKTPCGRCIADRCAHLCVREIVRVRGKPTVATPVEDENASLARQASRLQERVAELELALRMSLQGRPGDQPSPIDGPACEGSPTPTGSHQAHALEEVGAILDEWNLGPSKHEELGNLAVKKDMHYLVETLRSVPDKQTSTRIVEYSLQMLGWVHCALRVDHFLIEHEAFQNALIASTLEVLQDHKWMSVYFSVLAVGLFFMGDEDALSLNMPMIDSSPYPFSVCRHWYRAACLQLEYSDAMGKPQLHVVQVAAILTLCHPHFGQRYRDINLASLARSTAYALQMHCLASESSCPESLNRIREWADETGRELGRRLWWTLVICDWLAGPRSQAFISTDSFDCIVSTGRFDHNVILGGSPISDGVVVFSPLLHHIELARLAQMLHEYVKMSNKSPTTLCQFLNRLDELEHDFTSKADQLIASCRDGINQGRQVPVWIPGQRAHFLCSINFIRLVLCRALLQQNFVQLPAWAEIRNHGMRAALDIVHMNDVPPTYQLLWVFGSSTIAAGVFLCLDLLTCPQRRTEVEIQEGRGFVEVCISTLQKYSYKSTIGHEGSKTLRRFLDLESTQQERPIGQADLTQLIKSMARPFEKESLYSSLNEHEQSLWPALSTDLSSAGIVGNEEVFTPIVTSSLPEMVNTYEQSDAFWLMDSIMFPGY